MIAAAKHPIIIAGRGAARSGAGEALAALADQTGALLATSLFAKGLFDSHPFGIGIAGAFSSELGRELFANSDLVLGVGAILGHFTTEGGYLYPNAKVIHMDINPRGISQGVRVADLQVRSDAKLGAEALLAELRNRRFKGEGARSKELQHRIATHIYDTKKFSIPNDVVDPREVVLELDRTIPKDWDIVVGGGHYFNFVMPCLRNRAPERYHVVNEFGAIGSALSTAMGIAVARGDGKVALIEGDGSLLMHAQELETVKRHEIRMLMCVFNDGGYGAEIHKFRGRNMDAGETIHGRGDLAAMAQGFGLRGSTVKAAGMLGKMFDEHMRANQSTLWDVHIADIPSSQYRRLYYGEH
jgi:thiamine pyrophosphate-dependent acetolactate synthase large subunit-like protein